MKLMAFALVALLGFMVPKTEQQRFPYQMQSRVIPPWAILDAFSDTDLYSYMLLRKFGFPLNPSILAQPNANSEKNGPIVVQSSPADNPEEQYIDLQSRNKFSAVQQHEGSFNPRFLNNFVATIGSSYYNPLLKTVYYFTTSTTTATFTTTCITSLAFVTSSFTVICRKRRELLEVLSGLDTTEESGQGVNVSPSNVQQDQVTQTVDPTSGLEKVYVASSKEEDDLSYDTSDYATGDTVVRNKRFFGIYTTIVTTYVFSTVTTTRTLSTNLVSTSVLSCRPSQFTYC